MSKRRPFTENEVNVICKLWKEGKTATQICRIVESLSNRKPQTLYPVLIKNGLYQKKPYNDLRKFKVNDNYFKTIDTEHKAYWLGFMIADGFLSNSGHATKSFGMTLNSKDKYILELFKKDLESNYNIHDYTSEGHCTSKLLIKSESIYNDLLRYGLTVNKSYDATLPLDKIPENLVNHLIRGYFDGDGGFSKTSKNSYSLYCMGFTGTSEVIKSIRHILKKDNIKICQRFPDRNNNNCSLYISGDRQIYNIGKWLYHDATIYLVRKHDRYMEIFNKYNTKN
jgi:intein-encoded DNA endonuclease-like protein